jgi:glycosyltransferase involved in cell wall biosynthesis
VENPWLSVVVASHNRDRWLATALQSLADQGDAGIEVIAIDASADDACWRIISRFSTKLNLRAERRLDLESQTAKINFGVEQARADHICILHDDDLWLDNRSTELKKWLAAKPNAVMHLHPCYIIDDSGKRLGLWRCPLPAGDSPVSSEVLLQRLLVQCFIAVPAATIRRDAFLRVGGMDNNLWFAPDWDLYLKVVGLGEVYYHSAPLACYRIHNSSLTISASKDDAAFRQQYEMVMERHMAKLDPLVQGQVLPLARASINVNVALAAAAGGQYARLFDALGSVLSLGPKGARQYLAFSRIIDRSFPRLRALVAGKIQATMLR